MNLKLIVQGFIVGVGKIIPGVSGSMLAMFMGLYEPLMEAVTQFFDDKKKHFYLLFNFGIGLFLAIVLFSKIILFLLENYYYFTIYLFLGLIMGTVFRFKKNIKFHKKNIFIFVLAFSFMIFIPFLQTGESFFFQNTFLHYLYTLVLGGIDALTSIVPGISGTAIFMMLGSYQFVLNILGNPFSLLFLIYVIGLILGVIITCYLMYYLLKRFKEQTNVVIFAFSLASVFILFLGVYMEMNLTYFLLFIIGIFGGYLFDN
ncbi:putative membrane protein [Mycoplasma sp. CAG:776]|mgnify:CR=1 FL=1|nr:putative membrane protein [Mycoplasma sp. CAG:776]